MIARDSGNSRPRTPPCSLWQSISVGSTSIRMESVSRERKLIVVLALRAFRSKRALKRCKLHLDIPLLLLPGNDVLPVAAKEIIDRLNADANRTAGFVFIKILE